MGLVETKEVGKPVQNCDRCSLAVKFTSVQGVLHNPIYVQLKPRG